MLDIKEKLKGMIGRKKDGEEEMPEAAEGDKGSGADPNISGEDAAEEAGPDESSAGTAEGTAAQAEEAGDSPNRETADETARLEETEGENYEELKNQI